ncbi:MAG: hypothetical protein LBE15_05725 [Burkholderiales bacterium]|nr:hypothetical protein [Burkholderiales bacterium]
MTTVFGVCFTIHSLNKRATRSPALRSARHAALLLLAGWRPALSSRLAWRADHSTGKHAQLPFLGSRSFLMKSFCDQTYRCCYMVLAVLLVTGCTALSVPPEPEEIPPPVVEAPTPEEMLPPEEAPPIGDSARGPVVTPEETLLRQQLEEHVRFQKLLEDLARYSNLSAEESQRIQAELSGRISATAQGADNGSRIRLAYLQSLLPSGLGDQRALLMLETVIKNEKASASFQHLANILRTQIQEKRQTLQKLEALRDIDRLQLEERIPDNRIPPPIPTPTAPPKRP